MTSYPIQSHLEMFFNQHLQKSVLVDKVWISAKNFVVMLFDKNHEIYCFEPSNLVMTDSASDESDDKKKTAMNENQVNSKKKY